MSLSPAHAGRVKRKTLKWVVIIPSPRARVFRCENHESFCNDLQNGGHVSRQELARTLTTKSHKATPNRIFVKYQRVGTLLRSRLSKCKRHFS
jgi:hypothetical protein